MKKDEPKIRDLAETLVRAERQNDVATAKELLADDVIVNTPQQEARGKDAAALRLREAIRMSTVLPTNDGPLRFEELEAIGDWAYFRLRFFAGSWPLDRPQGTQRALARQTHLAGARGLRADPERC